MLVLRSSWKVTLRYGSDIFLGGVICLDLVLGVPQKVLYCLRRYSLSLFYFILYIYIYKFF